jgi:hypothetical protein
MNGMIKKAQKWEEEATGEAMETTEAAAATNAANRPRENRSEEKRTTRGSSSERRGDPGEVRVATDLISAN